MLVRLSTENPSLMLFNDASSRNSIISDIYSGDSRPINSSKCEIAACFDNPSLLNTSLSLFFSSHRQF